MALSSTRIYTSKNIDKVNCSDPKIPIINVDNAILSEIENNRYIINNNLSPIYSGLIKDNNQYYFFSHNIKESSSFRYYSEYAIDIKQSEKAYAYNIFLITDDLANKIIKTNLVNYWEIYFNSLYNYGLFYIVKNNRYSSQYFKYKSYLNENDGYLIIPFVTASNFPEGSTYLEFIKKTYNKTTRLDFNKFVYRNILLNELI